MNQINIRQGEWPRFLLAFTYFYFLLAGYFMLRPIRGTVSANHSEILHLLYTATFVSMLLIVPIFGWLVSKFRRGRFVPGIYLFFISNLVFFTFAFKGDATGDWCSTAFMSG